MYCEGTGISRLERCVLIVCDAHVHHLLSGQALKHLSRERLTRLPGGQVRVFGGPETIDANARSEQSV